MNTTDTWSFIAEAQWEPDELAMYPILLERLSYRSLPRLVAFQQQLKKIIQRSWNLELLSAFFLASPGIGLQPQGYAQGISFLMRYGRKRFIQFKKHPDLLHTLLPLPDEFVESSMLSICQEAYLLNHPESQNVPQDLAISFADFPLGFLGEYGDFKQRLPTLTRQCWSEQHETILSEGVAVQ